MVGLLKYSVNKIETLMVMTEDKTFPGFIYEETDPKK